MGLQQRTAVNHLRRRGGANTFTYDGIGRRVTKTDSTGSYNFVYDGDRIISDGQAFYTRAGEARLISERRGNDSRWHHSDGLTSTRTLTSSSQTVTDTFRYDVWGDIAERTGNTPTPHQFVGALGYEREADSGLIFIGTRYYDPTTGRFLSQDSTQYGVNWYLYAANNPVRNYDAQGRRAMALYDGGGYIGGGGGFEGGGGVVWDGRDWFDHLTDFMAGMGDTISLGLTDLVRDLMGTNEYVNHESGWYVGGQIAGEVWWIAFDAATACFVAGTLVQTPRGLKPIEDIKAGDWVRSRDERTGEVSYQPVKRTFRRVSQEIVTVKAGNETIQTTPEHPFWVEGKGWVAAKELVKGERLITADERVVVVTEVRVAAVRGPPVVVYNFEVENTHTYFVGREGVWVHNACGHGGPAHAGAIDDIAAQYEGQGFKVQINKELDNSGVRPDITVVDPVTGEPVRVIEVIDTHPPTPQAQGFYEELSDLIPVEFVWLK